MLIQENIEKSSIKIYIQALQMATSNLSLININGLRQLYPLNVLVFHVFKEKAVEVGLG